MEHLLQSIEDFHSRSAPVISYWGDMIRKAASEHERVVLWGSGSKAVAFLNTLGIDHEVEYVVDINPYRHGKYIPGTGQRIVLPEFLEEYRPDKVIVMNPVYCKEIAEKLKELNVKTELLSV
jgi:FlaA1/EpsC-like NDP-sugar epimerase